MKIFNICGHAAKNSALLAAAVAAVFLAVGSSHAVAGSVNQPGDTIGLPTGAPLPAGVYGIDTSSYGQRTNTVSGMGVNLPTLIWATPVYFYDTRLQFVVIQPDVYTTNTQHDVIYLNSTLLAGQLAHTFGNGFGASYQAGLRVGLGAPQAYQLSSFEQRLAGSYTASGWDLTANLINGDFGSNKLYPDWLNLDLTATKTFDKFEIGAVAFGSSDISSPTPTYKRQRQFAVGGLLGYNLGTVKVQAFVTRDVAERNYTGYDTRGWIRLIIPLYRDPTEVAAVEPIRERY